MSKHKRKPVDHTILIDGKDLKKLMTFVMDDFTERMKKKPMKQREEIMLMVGDNIHYAGVRYDAPAGRSKRFSERYVRVFIDDRSFLTLGSACRYGILEGEFIYALPKVIKVSDRYKHVFEGGECDG